MVGLLGTVSGMIHSFGSLATDVATSKPMMLAEWRFRGAGLHGQRPRGGYRGVHRLCLFPRTGAAAQLRTLKPPSTQILAVFSLYYTAKQQQLGPGAAEREREPVALDDEF